MKNIIKLIVGVILLSGTVGCKKYLDINSDPDTPQQPDASSVFPAMLANIPRGTQFDARYISKYIQNWGASASSRVEAIWDNHGFQGYPTATDVGGDIWRQAYFGLGSNLNYIIDNGLRKGQWDYVGAGYALKALMFQMCTDVYGDIIYTEAFKENTSVFKYDEQQTVYRGVDSLCRLAINYLGNNELNPSNTVLSKGDFVYGGDRTKWLRFVYGLLAQNFHRFTNKAGYNTTYADSVIKYVDLSFANGNDDFLVPFDASKNDDTNFFGTFRDNLTFFRQTNFIVKMMDGTSLAGSNAIANRDPRIRHLLSASNDTAGGPPGVYRGVDPGAGDAGAGNNRVAVPWSDSTYANPSAARFDPTKGKYLFRDKVVSPVMTYSQLQFMKAEAAYRKSDVNTAYTAYRNGITGHFDFINRGVMPRSNNQLFNTATITIAERNGYMASANVKASAATLTLTDIMLQKYIALWGWGFTETWVDMRRFHYTDNDPVTGTPVYRGFVAPAAVPAINNGRLAMRIRPRYNSEYVWNFPELERIGATLPDYHLKPIWFSLP